VVVEVDPIGAVVALVDVDDDAQLAPINPAIVAPTGTALRPTASPLMTRLRWSNLSIRPQ
jgi:hypothetical protein